MRFDPNHSTESTPPAPVAAREKKPKMTKAMKAFAELTDDTVKIILYGDPVSVPDVRQRFMEHLRVSGATDWQPAWATWRLQCMKAAVTPASPPPPPATAPFSPRPTCPPAVPSPPSPPAPVSPPDSVVHPWILRLQHRRQLGLSVRESGTLAIA